MTVAALILVLSNPEACGVPPCDDALLGSNDAILAVQPEFPLASAFLGTAASCLTVYQVRDDGSTRADCVTCDVVVDLSRAPVLGDTLTGVSRGELEARIRRTVSGFVFAPEHAGRWGQTYYEFILENDNAGKIPDRPDPARYPYPDTQTEHLN
jgi:hypothetical protein